MPIQDAGDTRTCVVLVNHEEQYSLWLGAGNRPRGGRFVGQAGSKEECLAYVREVWTDMRPPSLRGEPRESGTR